MSNHSWETETNFPHFFCGILLILGQLIILGTIVSGFVNLSEAGDFVLYGLFMGSACAGAGGMGFFAGKSITPDYGRNLFKGILAPLYFCGLVFRDEDNDDTSDQINVTARIRGCFFWLAGLMVLGGLGLFLYRAYSWLRSGYWEKYSVASFLIDGFHINFSNWVGLYQFTNWIQDWAALIVGGIIILWMAME